MSWTRRWSSRLTMATSATAGALGLCGWMFRQALVTQPIPTPAAPTRTPEIAALAMRLPTPTKLIQAAVAGDPFRAEREPATVAFRMPADAPTPNAAVERATIVTLIGTAVLPEGRSFAMCQVGTEVPKVVRVGDHLGDYTLRSVDQGRVVFLTSTGMPLEVRVAKAGSSR